MFTKNRLLFWGILLTSCAKPPHATVPPSPSSDSDTSLAVYVLGQADDTPRYWKNGAPTTLTGLAMTGISPKAMAVVGSDVFIAGTTGEAAAYWKDGQTFHLQAPPDQSDANAIFVSGGDIYTAGYTSYPFSLSVPYTSPTANYPISGPVATYWKNGVPSVLFGDDVLQVYNGYGNFLYGDFVSSLFVSGTDVYVAGYSDEYRMGNGGTYQFAKYWRNGVSVNLTSGLLDSTYANGQYYLTAFPYTSDIYVSGSDVYVSGNEYTFTTGPYEALYWKNGSLTYLPSPGSLTYANAIFASGSDVYVAGNLIGADGIYHAVYWKNGVPDTLSMVPEGSSANAIFVYGNDVYAAGYEDVGGYSYVTLWKNGMATHLNPPSLRVGAAAISIYVEGPSKEGL